jgi:hypothetical protein
MISAFNDSNPTAPQTELRLFWWFFALRGGFAALFACFLLSVGSLLGTIFFDPVMLVFLGLLLGFYVMGNGLLLGVAGGFAAEHRLHIWGLILGECAFAVILEEPLHNF